MATIKEVAREAGVSTATVSRVINDNYPVHDDTRLRVNAAIGKLGYKPNAVARGLKNKQTFLVGMITPDLSNPFFMEIAKGLESQISEHGYNIIFASSDERDKIKELTMLDMLHEKQVDAVILDTRHHRSDKINEYVAAGMKIVLIDAGLDKADADFVTEDNYNASRKAIEYAVNKGHRRIGILKGNMNASTARDRYQAYIDVMKENGFPVNQDYIMEGSYDREAAYEATIRMLKKVKYKLPSLVFSSNNRMTEGLLMAFMEYQIKVPEDVSIISFGNINLSQLVQPKLTYIEQRPFDIGVRAGELLLNRLSRSDKPYEYAKVVLETQFRIGNSVRDINNL